MKCFKCDGEEFVEELTKFAPEIKDEVVEFILPCLVCKRCKNPRIDTKQMDLLRKAGTDKYREKHNLLTSQQIIA